MVEVLFHDCQSCGEMNIPEDGLFLVHSEWDSCDKLICVPCFHTIDPRFV